MRQPGKSSRRTWIASGIGLVALGALGAGLAWSGRAPWPIRRVIHLPKPAYMGFISGDNRWLVTLDRKSSWVYTDLATGQPRQNPPTARTWAADYSRDRRTLVGVDFRADRSAVLLVDTASGAIQRRFTTDEKEVYRPMFGDEERSIEALAGTGTQFTALVTWDLATGTATRRPFRGPDGLSATKLLLDASPDRRILVFWDRQPNQFQLWDVAADRQLGGLIPSPVLLNGGPGMAWTPDSRRLFLARADGRVEVRDMAAPDSSRTLQVHSPEFRTNWIAISPDSRTLAADGYVGNPTNWFDQTWRKLRWKVSADWWYQAMTEVVVIDLASGRQRARFRGAIEPVFSPDGRSFVTRGWDAVYTVRDAPPPTEP